MDTSGDILCNLWCGGGMLMKYRLQSWFRFNCPKYWRFILKYQGAGMLTAQCTLPIGISPFS